MAVIALVKNPAWADIPWLRHGFSTRPGGRSLVYGGSSLNLGWTKEDDPTHIRENRAAFVNEIGGKEPGLRLVTIRQVHSGIVKAVSIEALSGRLESPDGKAVLEGDGLVTDVPGVLIAAGTADCVPIFVVDMSKRVVGAFHAGWRGTVAGIVGQGIDLMKCQYGSRPEDLSAAIGPSIGACCYEVGEEVREQFAGVFDYGRMLFHEEPSAGGEVIGLYVDLWQANRRQLIDAGVPNERIMVSGECTACSRLASGERKYFSHRAEHGHAGRMLNAIGIGSTPD